MTGATTGQPNDDGRSERALAASGLVADEVSGVGWIRGRYGLPTDVTRCGILL